MFFNSHSTFPLHPDYHANPFCNPGPPPGRRSFGIRFRRALCPQHPMKEVDIRPRKDRKYTKKLDFAQIRCENIFFRGKYYYLWLTP